MRRFAGVLALLALALLGPACEGSKSSGTPAPAGGAAAAPPPTSGYGGLVSYDKPGAFRMAARGGDGGAAAGGGSNGILIHNLSGSEAKVLNYGVVNARFTVPNDPLALGTNPRTISTDTELTVGGGLFAGQSFLLGDDGVTAATGLHVLKGAALTLHPNYDQDNADADNNPATGTKELCQLSFSQGILIEGSVVTTPSEGIPMYQASLALYADAGLIITQTGSISTRPAHVASGPGHSGGFITLYGSGAVINRGLVDGSGGAGDDGGWANGMYIYSGYWAIFNTGIIRANGAEGATGAGGSSLGVQIYSSLFGALGGGLFNSGTILAKGGNGPTGGGFASYIYSTNSGSDGPLINSGTIDASGGRCLANGNGGQAGFITIHSKGGGTFISGSVSARGGDGAGSGNGGGGNNLQISADASSSQPVSAGCFVGANLDTSGGNGTSGGGAGRIEVWNNATYNNGAALQPWVRPNQMPLVLAGYLSFDASGGDGGTTGGAAGPIQLNNYAANDPGGQPQLMDFRNETDLIARGGNGGSGAGGAGGAVLFAASSTYASTITTNTTRTALNQGRIVAFGGSGTAGGAGGSFTLFDPVRVRNEGAVQTMGGNASTGAGGTGGLVAIYSDGTTTNLADVTVNGGNSSSGTGGTGSQATIQGSSSTHAGTLQARGGNSASGNGGAGGRLRVLSFNGVTPSSVSGFLDVRGGAGAATGVEGTIVLDGIFQALIGGTLTF